MNNDKFIENNNIIPRGIIKWSPFNSLDGYANNINNYNIHLDDEEFIDIDEQSIELIEYTIRNLKPDHNYYIKYFSINHYYEYTGKLEFIKGNKINAGNKDINLTDIVDIYEVGKDV